MKKIFLSVSPGFYKTKLFNELSKRIDILVVYTDDYDKSSRNADFLGEKRKYPFINLSGNKWKQCISIIKILYSMDYDELVLGGYTSLQAWIAVLCSPRSRNACIIESTFRETSTNILKSILKRLFFKRLNKTYVCGTPHEKLTKLFGFRGITKTIYSVGLLNLVRQPKFEPRKQVKSFLFVGRLIPVKNLSWLINAFTKHQDLLLNIIGFGEQEEYLKSIVNSDNIHFYGAVSNKELPHYYQESDVFILPSLTETWGLVVEEALNNGTPVMCSHMVGSADDLILANNTGVVFELNNEKDFENKLAQICNIEFYNSLRKSISLMDFEKKQKLVIDSFI